MEGNNIDYLNLSVVTVQAVFKVIIICLCGYVATRCKLLPVAAQKQISALNINIFTPCLIFSKLASALTWETLKNVGIVPIFFCITTLITFCSGRIVSRLCKFNKAESNFVTAMAIFGNSNSVPVSLTMSLAYTLPYLRWPDIPNDTSDDVASRGMLYLVVFQQLGTILRWSWGYNTLLAKENFQVDKCDDDVEVGIENRGVSERDSLLINEEEGSENYGTVIRSGSSESSSSLPGLTRSPSPKSLTKVSSPSSITSSSSETSSIKSSKTTTNSFMRFLNNFLSLMNVPLWAMLAAIVVGSVPSIKRVFYEDNGFIQNTVSTAINELSSVAIPLVLIILGANLAPNDNEHLAPASKHYKRIIVASITSRMILPAIFLLPITALAVKFIQISILDDPVFLLVAFLLITSPPAIQLSQICQLNEVFEKEMAGVLFWGYAVFSVPASLSIVIASLKVIDWAGTTVV